MEKEMEGRSKGMLGGMVRGVKLKQFTGFSDLVGFYRPIIYNQICDYVQMKEPLEHYRIARDYIDRQGKYRRPGLLVLTGLMFGADPEELILPAAAQQISEDWILMQDDAEDDSDERRGKPAIQKIYGWVHAMNASNTPHIAMWKMLKDYMLKYGEKRGNRLFDKFYEMMQTTVEGQYIENKFIHNTKDLRQASEKMYMDIIYSKTCFYTIYGPMQLGAIAADQDDETLQWLKEVGTNVGNAFQIVDDILDMIADEKSFGKKNFGDLFEGKLTIPVLHAFQSATKDEQKQLNAIYAKKRSEKTAEEIAFIFKMVQKYDGIGYASKMAESFGAKAEALVKSRADRLPKNEYSKMFLEGLREMYVRKK